MARKRNREPSEAQDATQRKTKKFKKEKPKQNMPKKKQPKKENQKKRMPTNIERKYTTAVDPEISDEDVMSNGEQNDDVAYTRGTDPFAEHFEKEISDDLANKLLADDKSKGATLWNSSEVMLPHLGEAEFFQPTDSSEALSMCDENDLIKLHVKKSLVDQLSTVNEWKPSPSGDSTCQLSKLQLELFTVMNSYKDLYFPRRNHKNGEEVRLAYCLHALNHVLKTRNRVIRHNKKIESKKDEISDELRDQGLTRPKVLIVLPFRDSALKVVHLMMKLLSNREYTVASKHRFESEFGSTVDSKKGLKPEDFEATFDGNIDDQFRIGISISKKALKLYEEFYSSDIILASPLGLWTIIGAQNEKERDFEFLSSIEILIFDQMDVFFMQNFEHVMHVFSHLHHVPKEMHGVDYFRVRMWNLNGWSKVYRQTLMFGSITHPMIETIFRRQCVNYSGKLKVLNFPSSGTISDVRTIHPLLQIFQRINVDSVQECPDSRFNFFIKQILPHYVDGMVAAQTLIFVSSYFDFVRLRNFLVKENQNGNGAPVALLSEYSKKSGISKSRQFFLEGKVRFLLFSERFHFFRRYKIRGIQHLIFFDLPIYPHFYPEMCNMIEDSKGSAVEKYNQMCTVLFTKYDMDRLVPVIGYEKTCELLSAEKNVQTFHSS